MERNAEESVAKSKDSSSDFFHNAIQPDISKDKIVLQFSVENKNEKQEVISKNHLVELHLKPKMLAGLVGILLSIAANYNKSYGTDLLGLNEILSSKEDSEAK